MVAATVGLSCCRHSPALQTSESMAGRLASAQRGRGEAFSAAISAGLFKSFSSLWVANSSSASSGRGFAEEHCFPPRRTLCNVGHVAAKRAYYRGGEGEERRPNTQVAVAYEQYGAPQEPERGGFRRPPVVKWEKDLANAVQLIGRVGRDIEIKYMDSGKVLATTSLAVSKGRNEEPSWFFLEMWDELGEIAAHHVAKGEQILVTGRIVIEKRVKDEVTYTNVKIAVSDLCFVEPFSDRRQPYGQSQAEEKSTDSTQRNWNQQQFSSQPAQGAPVQNASSSSDEDLATEKRWQEYFADPTQWWDNRLRKRNPKAPDFKHKSTQEALWIDSWRNPPWVEQQLAVLEEKKGQHKGDFGNSSRSQDKKLSSFKDSDILY